MNTYKGLKVPEYRYSIDSRARMDEKCGEIQGASACLEVFCGECVFNDVKVFEQWEKDNNNPIVETIEIEGVEWIEGETIYPTGMGLRETLVKLVGEHGMKMILEIPRD